MLLLNILFMAYTIVTLVDIALHDWTTWSGSARLTYGHGILTALIGTD